MPLVQGTRLARVSQFILENNELNVGQGKLLSLLEFKCTFIFFSDSTVFENKNVAKKLISQIVLVTPPAKLALRQLI